MGLDITAYRRLTLVPDAHSLPEDDRCDLMQVFNIACFSPRAAGLLDGAFYSAPDGDGNSIGFRAGSYGGYNRWREQLAKMAGYPAHEDRSYRSDPTHSAGAWSAEEGPFWELINFADNEGVIGPIVSAKLAKDFAEFDERAKAFDGEYFYSLYALWRQAFDLAADGGAVSFH